MDFTPPVVGPVPKHFFKTDGLEALLTIQESRGQRTRGKSKKKKKKKKKRRR
jgi:hypothetical protein